MKSTLALILLSALVAPLCGCSEAPTKPKAQEARTYNVRVLSPSSGPLAGASVMVQTRSQNFVSSTDANGVAAVVIPNTVTLPSQVIIMATHWSIMPEARTCPGDLNAIANPTISTVAMPASMLVRDVYLHHLGNDLYGGDPNSQLQLASEGLEHSYSFSLGGVPNYMPVIRVFARGVQYPTQIKINGVVVNSLANSSGDGALSLYNFRLAGSPGNLLRSGVNTLSIRTASVGGSDPYDDIEFVGLVLYF